MEFEREKNISQELLKLVWKLIGWSLGVELGSLIIVLGPRLVAILGTNLDNVGISIWSTIFIILGSIIAIACGIYLFITCALVVYNIVKFGIRDGRVAEKRIINEEESYKKYVKELEKQNAEKVANEALEKASKKTQRNNPEADESDCDYEEIV